MKRKTLSLLILMISTVPIARWNNELAEPQRKGLTGFTYHRDNIIHFNYLNTWTRIVEHCLGLRPIDEIIAIYLKLYNDHYRLRHFYKHLKFNVLTSTFKFYNRNADLFSIIKETVIRATALQSENAYPTKASFVLPDYDNYPDPTQYKSKWVTKDTLRFQGGHMLQVTSKFRNNCV